MPWSDINYTQKCFSLRKLTEIKEDSLTATFSSWRSQKKQVVSGFKTSFCRLDRLIHSSFKSNIHYPIQESRLVSGFKTPLCKQYRTDAFWETKMLKNQISISVCGCVSYCLEHILDWVWVQKCVPDSTCHCGWFFCWKNYFLFTNVGHNKCHHEGQKYHCFQFVKQNFKILRYAFWADANRNTMEQKLFHIFL